jgi:hypothetical protein
MKNSVTFERDHEHDDRALPTPITPTPITSTMITTI